MKTARSRPIALFLVALVAAALVPLSAGVAEAAGGATSAAGGLPTIGPGLAREAAALSPEDRIEVIVSAWAFEGLGALDAMGITHRRLRTVPVAFATPTAGQLQELAAMPAIRSLWPRERAGLLLGESTQVVGADRAERALGVNGKGVAVAVVDTGIDATHPDLPWHDKVVANYEIAANPFDPEADLFVDLPDTDDDGHGTHVSSTVAGNDADGKHLHDGVAPGAQLYGYSTNVGLLIDIARALAAFDDVIAKRREGAPIVAISNSWGGGPGDYNPDDPLSILTRAAYDAGIAVVFAAGNSGQDDGELDTASDQCTMPWVVCVGAETKPGQLVQFSSRGRPPVPTEVAMPDGDEFEIRAGNHDRALGQRMDIGVFRPTVTAPGVNIVAACSLSACGGAEQYQSLSGTSMATPHVSGVVALVSAARLEATGRLDLGAGHVIDLLEGTANPMPGWELWEVGAGEVDAYEAVRLALRPRPRIPIPNLGASPAPAGTAKVQQFDGLVAPASFTTRVGFGEHRVKVPAGTARLDLTLTWDLSTDNLYMFAWRPGTDPDGADANRADQESWGLLEGLGPRTQTFRLGTIPYPEPGTWTVRVYGRVNPAPTPYHLEAAASPAARLQLEVSRVRASRRGVTLSGTAAFPARPDAGITRESVVGSALPVRLVGEPVRYFLHGNLAEVDKHTDFWFGASGPTFDQEAPGAALSQFQTGGWYGNPDFAGNFLLAYWRGPFSGTIQGDVPLSVWVSSATQSRGGQLTFTLFDFDPEEFFGTGFPVIGRVTVSAAGVGPAPTRVDAVIRDVAYTVPPEHELILQVSGAFINADYFTVLYDSTAHPAEFSVPVLEGGLERPSDLRVTDVAGGGVRLSWKPVSGATSYAVYRSDRADRLGSLIGVVAGGGDLVAFADRSVRPGAVAYYRVAARSASVESEPSDAAYGTPVADLLWVEARAGRGPWQEAAGTGRWAIVILPATGPGADPETFTVRARTWAGSSSEVVVRRAA